MTLQNDISDSSDPEIDGPPDPDPDPVEPEEKIDFSEFEQGDRLVESLQKGGKPKKKRRRKLKSIKEQHADKEAEEQREGKKLLEKQIAAKAKNLKDNRDEIEEIIADSHLTYPDLPLDHVVADEVRRLRNAIAANSIKAKRDHLLSTISPLSPQFYSGLNRIITYVNRTENTVYEMSFRAAVENALKKKVNLNKQFSYRFATNGLQLGKTMGIDPDEARAIINFLVNIGAWIPIDNKGSKGKIIIYELGVHEKTPYTDKKKRERIKWDDYFYYRFRGMRSKRKRNNWETVKTLDRYYRDIKSEAKKYYKKFLESYNNDHLGIFNKLDDDRINEMSKLEIRIKITKRVAKDWRIEWRKQN